MRVAFLHWVVSGPTRENLNEPWHLVCLVERSGKVETAKLFYEGYHEAQHVVEHFKVSIEPIPLFIADDDDEEGDEEDV